jgi:hypothetical protein
MQDTLIYVSQAHPAGTWRVAWLSFDVETTPLMVPRLARRGSRYTFRDRILHLLVFRRLRLRVRPNSCFTWAHPFKFALTSDPNALWLNLSSGWRYSIVWPVWFFRVPTLQFDKSCPFCLHSGARNLPCGSLIPIIQSAHTYTYSESPPDKRPLTSDSDGDENVISLCLPLSSWCLPLCTSTSSAAIFQLLPFSSFVMWCRALSLFFFALAGGCVTSSPSHVASVVGSVIDPSRSVSGAEISHSGHSFLDGGVHSIHSVTLQNSPYHISSRLKNKYSEPRVRIQHIHNSIIFSFPFLSSFRGSLMMNEYFPYSNQVCKEVVYIYPVTGVLLFSHGFVPAPSFMKRVWRVNK